MRGFVWRSPVVAVLVLAALPSASAARVSGSATTTKLTSKNVGAVALSSARLTLAVHRIAGGKLQIVATADVVTSRHGAATAPTWVQVSPCMAALNPYEIPFDGPVLSFRGYPIGRSFVLRQLPTHQSFEFKGVVSSNEVGYPADVEPNWTDCARANFGGQAGALFQKDAIVVLTTTDSHGNHKSYPASAPTGN